MKVITSIYLNCRPDLRDEWLAGNEVDDPNDAQVGVRVLRRILVSFVDFRLGPEPGKRVAGIDTIL